MNVQADSMINVLEMAPVGDAIYARAVLAAATDAESAFGAVIDNPSAAGEEVAGTGLYAGLEVRSHRAVDGKDCCPQDESGCHI